MVRLGPVCFNVAGLEVVEESVRAAAFAKAKAEAGELGPLAGSAAVDVVVAWWTDAAGASVSTVVDADAGAGTGPNAGADAGVGAGTGANAPASTD